MLSLLGECVLIVGHQTRHSATRSQVLWKSVTQDNPSNIREIYSITLLWTRPLYITGWFISYTASQKGCLYRLRYIYLDIFFIIIVSYVSQQQQQQKEVEEEEEENEEEVIIYNNNNQGQSNP